MDDRQITKKLLMAFAVFLVMAVSCFGSGISFSEPQLANKEAVLYLKADSEASSMDLVISYDSSALKLNYVKAVAEGCLLSYEPGNGSVAVSVASSSVIKGRFLELGFEKLKAEDSYVSVSYVKAYSEDGKKIALGSASAIVSFAPENAYSFAAYGFIGLLFLFFAYIAFKIIRKIKKKK